MGRKIIGKSSWKGLIVLVLTLSIYCSGKSSVSDAGNSDDADGSGSNNAASEPGNNNGAKDPNAVTSNSSPMEIHRISTGRILNWPRSNAPGTPLTWNGYYNIYYSISNNIQTLAQIDQNGTLITAGPFPGVASDDTPYWFNIVTTDMSGNRTAYQSVTASGAIVDNENGTITDPNTNLTWKKCSEGQENDASCTGLARTYQYCQDNSFFFACDAAWTSSLNQSSLASGPAYNACNTLNAIQFGGKFQWRVPTFAELTNFMISVYIPNKNIFPSAQGTYWTSSMNGAWANFADFSGFYTGYDIKDNAHFIRCVSP